MAYLNYENKSGSGKKLRVHFDLPEDDDYPDSVMRNSTSSNSSDSSLDSDDTEKDHNSIDNNNEAKYDDNDNVCDSPVWNFSSGSATQSPPVQVMSPCSAYDPNRIPSSVFARSPSTIEWSLASNESLFSLHLGNNSFSRELAFTFNKSGELPRTSDFAGIPMAMPPVQEANRERNVDVKKHTLSSDSLSEEGTAQLGVEDGHKNAETSAHSKEAVVTGVEAKNYASISYRSMASDMSTRSFQFPILTADGGRRSSVSGGARHSSSTVESEKNLEKTENHYQEEKPPTPPTPEAETAEPPKKGGSSWCYCCCSWSPCF